jgi:phage recombination protein Bet
MEPTTTATTTAIATAPAIIRRQNAKPVVITLQDVKRLLCPNATDVEISLFLRTCEDEQLNPFTKEIYLIKYSLNDPASIVIAIESHLKVAESRPNYDGHEAGILVKSPGKPIEHRFGEYYDEKEELAGGWAKVYLKDRGRPIYAAVRLQEYMRYTKEGKPSKFWRDAPAAQIRKVALVHALREAFPSRFAGTTTEGDYQEVTEDSIPEAFRKGEEENWKLFWAKQKEKGLNYEASLAILGIQKMHEDWLDQGKTLEQADKALTDYLNRKPESDIKPATGQKIEPALPGETKITTDTIGTASSPTAAETDKAPVTVAEKKDGKPTEAEIQKAFDDLKSQRKSPIDIEWLKDTVHELRVKGCKEVSTAALYSRFKDYYHIMDSELDGKTYYQCADLLLGAQVKDFCDWLQALVDQTK